MPDESAVSVEAIFGSNVFSDAVMRERLPKNVCNALRRTIAYGEELDPSIADVTGSSR